LPIDPRQVNDAAMSEAGASKRPNTAGLRPAWKPGQSGNVRGRPPAKFDLPAACREHAAAAVQVLVDALRDPKNKIEAAKALLDRGFGRAPLVIEGDGVMTLQALHFVAAQEMGRQLQALMGRWPTTAND
jgi:hypothetical protein